MHLIFYVNCLRVFFEVLNGLLMWPDMDEGTSWMKSSIASLMSKGVRVSLTILEFVAVLFHRFRHPE